MVRCVKYKKIILNLRSLMFLIWPIPIWLGRWDHSLSMRVFIGMVIHYRNISMMFVRAQCLQLYMSIISMRKPNNKPPKPQFSDALYNPCLVSLQGLPHDSSTTICRSCRLVLIVYQGWNQPVWIYLQFAHSYKLYHNYISLQYIPIGGSTTNQYDRFAHQTCNRTCIPIL